ncbi:hypothetical protein QE152_g7452 [Popillia japonica]|uniref:Protein bicaudal C homolog 1 KH-like domain-containing protein n=1 Tax=Popillia japonica TaxID=7064 RepID=A0AAW1MEI9_POPJA
MFDLPQDTTGLPIRSENLTEIQTKYDVTISIRPKAKQSTKACIIKGTEKWAGNIYKSRNKILGTDDPQVIVDIPASYHMPKVASNLQQAMEITIPSMNNQTPLSPMLSPLISPNWQYPPNPFSQSNSFMNMMQQTHQYFFIPLHNSLSSSGLCKIAQLAKRIAGFKAMQNRPTGGGYRYPNSTWSRYGISHTTPGIALPKSDFDMNPMDNDIWKTPTPQQNTDVWQMDANSSNFLDRTPGNVVMFGESKRFKDQMAQT